MCGRIIRTSPREAVAAHFAAQPDGDLDFRPRYNLCPSERLLAIVQDGAQRRVIAMRWGFVAEAASPGKRRAPLINARSETVAGQALFRAAFQTRRCVVVADGFYEWQTTAQGRVPYVVRLRSQGPFGIAGLFEPADDGPTGVVLTGPPNELVAPVHHRMPILLDDGGVRAWLAPASDLPTLRALMRPFPSSAMEVFAVSTAVNNPRNDGPECVAPAPSPTPAPQGTFAFAPARRNQRNSE